MSQKTNRTNSLSTHKTNRPDERSEYVVIEIRRFLRSYLGKASYWVVVMHNRTAITLHLIRRSCGSVTRGPDTRLIVRGPISVVCGSGLK